MDSLSVMHCGDRNSDFEGCLDWLRLCVCKLLIHQQNCRQTTNKRKMQQFHTQKTTWKRHIKCEFVVKLSKWQQFTACDSMIASKNHLLFHVLLYRVLPMCSVRLTNAVYLIAKRWTFLCAFVIIPPHFSTCVAIEKEWSNFFLNTFPCSEQQNNTHKKWLANA